MLVRKFSMFSDKTSVIQEATVGSIFFADAFFILSGL